VDEIKYIMVDRSRVRYVRFARPISLCDDGFMYEEDIPYEAFEVYLEEKPWGCRCKHVPEIKTAFIMQREAHQWPS
jgi:hypothetical protein